MIGEVEPMVVDCPACGGDGGGEVWTGYDPRDGSATGYWQNCATCDGAREVEIIPEVAGPDDLMEPA